MIELSGVTKTYGGTVKAVDGLSLTVPEGMIMGFLGPNGAGKTTTLKMITGILRPDEGVIRVNGFNLAQSPLEVKKRIGYVPDNPDQFLRLKGIEYLNFMADVFGVSSALRRDRITEYAERFELADALHDEVQSYSHGMRQKIVLLGVLVHDPEVFILDEPMTGLDPKSAFALKEILRDFAKRGRTVFFSTHVLDVAEKFCDRVAVIHRGRLIFDGTIKDMKSRFKKDESLESMFLEMTEDD
jgi:ABC-2 type transport system ATP-binding protein